MEKIVHTSYEKLADLTWETGNSLPESGIIHVAFDHIYEFFRLIDGSPNKYILISSNSDYGLVEQANEPVERDLTKYFQMIDVKGLNYSTLVIPARCNVELCRIDDKYSI